MMGASETVCITCGQPAGDFSRLNHLPSGRVCPTCRDRLLEALPPLLPGGLDESEEPREVEHLEQHEVILGPVPPDTPA